MLPNYKELDENKVQHMVKKFGKINLQNVDQLVERRAAKIGEFNRMHETLGDQESLKWTLEWPLEERPDYAQWKQLALCDLAKRPEMTADGLDYLQFVEKVEPERKKEHE